MESDIVSILDLESVTDLDSGLDFESDTDLELSTFSSDVPYEPFSNRFFLKYLFTCCLIILILLVCFLNEQPYVSKDAIVESIKNI